MFEFEGPSLDGEVVGFGTSELDSGLLVDVGEKLLDLVEGVKKDVFAVVSVLEKVAIRALAFV